MHSHRNSLRAEEKQPASQSDWYLGLISLNFTFIFECYSWPLTVDLQVKSFFPGSFMMWRLPVNAAQSSEYVSYPWKCPPSDEEICGALTAQYRSAYRSDFMGMPQVRTSTRLFFQSCAYESVSEQLNRWHSSMQTCLDETISVVVISLPTAYFSFLVEFLWQDMILRLAMKHSRREVAPFTETETRIVTASQSKNLNCCTTATT